MAKDVTKSIWIFDTVGDYEGAKGGAEPVYPCSIYIRQIKVDTGDGGAFLLSESSGGTRILKLDNTPADDTLWVEMNKEVKGLYLTTLPTNGSIEIHTGRSA